MRSGSLGADGSERTKLGTAPAGAAAEALGVDSASSSRPRSLRTSCGECGLSSRGSSSCIVGVEGSTAPFSCGCAASECLACISCCGSGSTPSACCCGRVSGSRPSSSLTSSSSSAAAAGSEGSEGATGGVGAGPPSLWWRRVARKWGIQAGGRRQKRTTDATIREIPISAIAG